MTNKMSRLLALLLVLAMLLPSVLTVVPVRAEEAVTELPTETLPADTESDAETTPVFYQNNFVEESQLEILICTSPAPANLWLLTAC